MVNIRLKILDKGRIVEEQLLRVLQKHEDALIEMENLIRGLETSTYYFIAYGDSKGEDEIGRGTVGTTGVVTPKYIQVKVLTNSTDQSFVNQSFYVKSDIKTDGTTLFQLYTGAGTGATGMYVAVQEEAFE